MTSEFKPGDIVRMGGAFYHVDTVHRDGMLDCIADADDKRRGLNPRLGGITKATMVELVEHRKQQDLLRIKPGAQ